MFLLLFSMFSFLFFVLTLFSEIKSLNSCLCTYCKVICTHSPLSSFSANCVSGICYRIPVTTEVCAMKKWMFAIIPLLQDRSMECLSWMVLPQSPSWPWSHLRFLSDICKPLCTGSHCSAHYNCVTPAHSHALQQVCSQSKSSSFPNSFSILFGTKLVSLPFAYF